MTIKANEVYQTLRRILGPWFKSEGFRRTKAGMLGWYKDFNGQFLVVGFYCWPAPGGDPLYGSSFTVDLGISDRPSIGGGRTTMRLNDLLSDIQLDRVLEIQNAVIAKLTKPDKNHYIFKMPRTLVDLYLSEFEPLTRDNVHWYFQWLRYQDAEDVRRWGEFILHLLPDLLQTFVSRVLPYQQ